MAGDDGRAAPAASAGGSPSSDPPSSDPTAYPPPGAGLPGKKRPTGSGDPGSVRGGLAAGVIAFVIWGFLPMLMKAIAAASPFEIIGHRILWSIPFSAVILTWRAQWGETLRALRRPSIVGPLALSALIIGVNWFGYVWAVVNDQVMQASLGYFINPLMFVAAGVVVMNERLGRIQIAAVSLAAIGVVALIIGTGEAPWVALFLAASFTIYGFVRKTSPAGAVPGLFIETLVLAPLALILLVVIARTSGLTFGSGGIALDLLLVLAGPATIIPLTFFAIAARRLHLSTIGFLQYIGPSLQFALALYYGEPFTAAHAVCFGLIWAGLALLSFDAVRKARDQKSAAAQNEP